MPKHALDLLNSGLDAVPAVVVLFGDESFLMQQVRQKLAQVVIGPQSSEASTSIRRVNGAEVAWRDIADDLRSRALFGGGRQFIVVEEADAFVSENRSRLEDYCAKPSPSNVLLLEVKKWLKTTLLYKAVEKNGLNIECRAPMSGKAVDSAQVAKWIQNWAKTRHQASMTAEAARLLVDLSGTHFGLLDQQAAKLALYVSEKEKISPEHVRDYVGGWQTKTTWELIDAAAAGDVKTALEQLDHLLQDGEVAIALMGQVSWSLRRLAAATRLYELRMKQGTRPNLTQALKDAGIGRWPQAALPNAERQLRQLGRDRARMLYRWLLEVDLAIKSSHSTPQRARLALETLLFRMARELGPAAR